MSLDVLRSLLDKATPRPWWADYYYITARLPGGRPGRGEVMAEMRVTASSLREAYTEEMRCANAVLIVALVNAAEELLACVDALREIANQQPETAEMIRRNGFVFDDIGHEPGNWQHLAFTIYTDLCRIESLASPALARLDARLGEPGGASTEPGGKT